jgi:hypothetical protein
MRDIGRVTCIWSHSLAGSDVQIRTVLLSQRATGYVRVGFDELPLMPIPPALRPLRDRDGPAVWERTPGNIGYVTARVYTVRQQL